jgi:capsular polysaccharide export protein
VAQNIASNITYSGEQTVIKGGLSAFKNKRVLMLQGPIGPFFRRLARDLEQVGAQVCKIDFNGGDWLFSPGNSIAFKGTADEWPEFFEQALIECTIDMVLLFGDCRPLHRIAHHIAVRRGVEIGVFEEGYVRPDYITMERFGVNGHSLIPRTPIFYQNTPLSEVPPTISAGNTFWPTAWWAILYYVASVLLWPLFRHYQHHRPLSLLEGIPWLRSAWRKFKYARKERGVQTGLATTLSGRFFLVPLQVHNDAQVHVHSDFDSVAAFIDAVLSSFAKNAPAETLLVIKHHPMDRGYHDHTRLIDQLAQTHCIQERVLYIHDQHLPTLLEHACGVVVVNSTVGLSALHHSTPLKVCGAALYDMKGLTYQGSLDEFWANVQANPIDRDLYARFRNYLIKYTQLNGSFYRRLNIQGSCAGLVWAPTFEEADTEALVEGKDHFSNAKETPIYSYVLATMQKTETSPDQDSLSQPNFVLGHQNVLKDEILSTQMRHQKESVEV